MIHKLKSYPYNFKAVVDGTMSFQLRVADRDYRVGDLLFLQEYDEESGYSGRTQVTRINNVIMGDGLDVEYVILNMELVSLAIVDGERYVTKI